MAVTTGAADPSGDTPPTYSPYNVPAEGAVMRRTARIGLTIATSLLGPLTMAAPVNAALPSQPKDPATTTTQIEPATATERLPRTAGPGGATNGAGLMAHLDGVCNTGELCLWYNFGWRGSYADFWWAANDLAANVFLGPGAGQGQVVTNNAESVWNYDYSYTAMLCTEAYHTGNCLPVPPRSGRDLYGVFINNVESIQWLPPVGVARDPRS
ncbi:peptidase inhibitor family I36 protein [Micromonosporaceae bacterium B7E4]